MKTTKSINFILILFLLSCNNSEQKIKDDNKVNEIEKQEIIDTLTSQQKYLVIPDNSINYLKVDTVLFLTDNKNLFQLGKSESGDGGWSYAQVINDSILFAYDDVHFNMKLLNIYSGKVDTVVDDYVNYDFHSFKAIRGELFRHANTMLYRFDKNLNLKDSIVVSENLSDDYAQCDFVEDSHSIPTCLDILYPKGYSRVKIKKEELISVPYLERMTDSTIHYGINSYKVRRLPKNTTFIFHYENKIYSVYSSVDKYMLLIHHYEESLKGY